VRVGVNKEIVPPPLHPLPPREGMAVGSWGDQGIIKISELFFFDQTLFGPAPSPVIDVEDGLIIFPF